MTCIKCGGSIHMEALNCFHCGTPIDHRANVSIMDWLSSSTVADLKENRARRFAKKIPFTRLSQFFTWLPLFIPALLMPYIFRISIEKYKNADSILLDMALVVIAFLVFYSVKKALHKPSDQ